MGFQARARLRRRRRAGVTLDFRRAVVVLRRAVVAIALVLAVVLALGTRVWLAALPARWSLASLDGFFLFGPAQLHWGRELAAGRVSLWNPLLGLGISEAADINLALLYPPSAIFALLPLHVASEVLAVAHIALAAVAVFFLCRQASLGIAGGAVAAVVLATGINVHHLSYFTSMLATFAWAPAAFLAASRLGERPTPRRALVLALILGLQLLAGYLQLHLYTVVCLPLFFLPVKRLAGFARPFTWMVAAELVAVALGAFALAPAMVAIEGSWRGAAAVPSLLHHIFPVALGDYRQGLAAPALDPRAPVYAGPLLPPLLLAGAMARGIAPRLRVPAFVLTGVAVVLSLGDATPIFPLLRRLPIGHWFTGPYKWTFFASLGAALLAGVGAHALLLPEAVSAFRTRLWAVLALGLVVSLPSSLVARGVAAAAIVGLVLVRRLVPPGLRAVTAAALPIFVGATTLASYDVRGVTPADVPEFFARYHPAYSYLAGRQADGRTFVLVPVWAISPRQGEIEGVAQVNTNGVIVSVRLARYAAAVYEAAAARGAVRVAALLRAIGARFVMTGPKADSWLSEVGLARMLESPGADVWEDASALPRTYLASRIERLPAQEVLARLADPDVAATRTAVLEVEEGTGGSAGQGEAHFVEASDTRVIVAVDAASAATLVLLDAWSPDWRAWVDGQPVPVRHANWLARTVEVPAGRHEVVFRFVPIVFYAGLAVSALTALGCGVAAVVLRRAT